MNGGACNASNWSARSDRRGPRPVIASHGIHATDLRPWLSDSAAQGPALAARRALPPAQRSLPRSGSSTAQSTPLRRPMIAEHRAGVAHGTRERRTEAAATTRRPVAEIAHGGLRAAARTVRVGARSRATDHGQAVNGRPATCNRRKTLMAPRTRLVPVARLGGRLDNDSPTYVFAPDLSLTLALAYDSLGAPTTAAARPSSGGRTSRRWPPPCRVLARGALRRLGDLTAPRRALRHRQRMDRRRSRMDVREGVRAGRDGGVALARVIGVEQVEILGRRTLRRLRTSPTQRSPTG